MRDLERAVWGAAVSVGAGLAIVALGAVRSEPETEPGLVAWLLLPLLLAAVGFVAVAMVEGVDRIVWSSGCHCRR